MTATIEKAFAEFVTTPAKRVTAAAKANRYRAKVSQCDVVNSNGRVYPRAMMAANIQRLKPLLGQGRLAGSVDHLDYNASGAMRSEAILWRDLTLESDGSVVGEFEIVPTRTGSDLKILLDAGRQVGFSTFGFGHSRPPTDSERRQYHMDPGDDEAVVMSEDYRLLAVDAVSDPSVTDAFLFRESRERGAVPRQPGTAAEPKPEPALTGIAAEMAEIAEISHRPLPVRTAAEEARSRLAMLGFSEIDPRVLGVTERLVSAELTRQPALDATAVDGLIDTALADARKAITAMDAARRENGSPDLACVAG